MDEQQMDAKCDANDMCEVEDKISQDAELRARYTKALMYIVNSEKPSRYDDIFRVLSANASDRCRAALAAVKAY